MEIEDRMGKAYFDELESVRNIHFGVADRLLLRRFNVGEIPYEGDDFKYGVMLDIKRYGYSLLLCIN